MSAKQKIKKSLKILAEKIGLEKCENKLIKKLKLKEIKNKFENYLLERSARQSLRSLRRDRGATSPRTDPWIAS